MKRKEAGRDGAEGTSLKQPDVYVYIYIPPTVNINTVRLARLYL